jgi:hypothetical protein
MELWSQYRDDVKESHEASRLMTRLEETKGEFEGKIKGAVNEFSRELNLNPDKAAKFADKLLHLVADMQKENIKHAKVLLDHLVSAGKKGQSLEKHLDKEMLKDIEHEAKNIEKDVADGMALEDLKHLPDGALPDGDASESEDKEDSEDPLKDMLEGFFSVFDDHEQEFGGKVRENFNKGGAVYDQLKALHTKITEGKDHPPSEEEVAEELDKIDLASVGAPLGSGRVLQINDIVEELVLIPKVPHEELHSLEKKWRAGELDSVTLFTKLQELHDKGVIPSGWLQMGVNRQEKGLE